MYDPHCNAVDKAQARFSTLQACYERPGPKTEPNDDGMSEMQREALVRGIQPHDEASLRIVEFECNNPWNTFKDDSQPLYLENSKGLQRNDKPNLAESSGDHESSVEKPVSSVRFSHLASPDSGKGSGMERPNTDRMLWMIGLSALVALPVFAILWRRNPKRQRREEKPSCPPVGRQRNQSFVLLDRSSVTEN